MNASLFGKLTCGFSLLLLSLLGACTPQGASPPSPTNNVPAATNTVADASTDAAPAMDIAGEPAPVPPEPLPTPAPDNGVASVAPPGPGELSLTPNDAATASELPPDVFPASPLAQVIRLAQAGMDESVILTYIASANSTFNLDSDKIIYLRDIGLPNEIVTAMMQRDQELRQQMAGAEPAPQPAPADTTAETATAPPAEQPAAAPTAVTINYFYGTLAPYGSWVVLDGYGWCWRPSAVIYDPGWQPYCNHGRWIYTDCGWYWSSDYSWGWAAFHYGRWFRHSHWGWCWVPDTIWGPSWVTWRHGSGYCGWAPLPPYAAYRAGIGFLYRGSAVSIGFNWGLSENCFTFVPTQYFCDPHPRRHCLAPAQVAQVFNQTTIINNFDERDHGRGFVNRGIEPDRITAVTHVPIRPLALRSAVTPPGQGPRGDQLSHDGSTLIVSRPPPPGHPAGSERQPRLPVVTTRMPQDSRAIGFPPRRDGNPPVAPIHPGPRPQGPIAISRPSPDDGAIRVPPGRDATQPVMPAPPAQQPQRPVVIPHSPPDAGAIRVPAQRPVQPASPPVNYNQAPAPNRGGPSYPPRQWEQNRVSGAPRNSPDNSGAPAFTPPARPGSSGAPEAGRPNPPVAAPSQPQPQPRQPASPPPAPSAPRSIGQNQNQNGFGNNFGGGAGVSPGPGPRR